MEPRISGEATPELEYLGKSGHTNQRLAHICYFWDKYVSYARNCKNANLIQYNMQYTPCIYYAFLAQENCSTLILPKVSKKARKLRHILIS